MQFFYNFDIQKYSYYWCETGKNTLFLMCTVKATHPEGLSDTVAIAL